MKYKEALEKLPKEKIYMMGYKDGANDISSKEMDKQNKRIFIAGIMLIVVAFIYLMFKLPN